MNKQKPLERRKSVFTKTDGHCHLCHKKLSFSNYGKNGTKGSWHIEHSVARANGGTDHLNNLFAACIKCNIEKGTLHTKTARRKNGVSRAPWSKNRKDKVRNDNTLGGAAIGALLGAPLGPGGVFIGGALGAIFGNSNSPRK